MTTWIFAVLGLFVVQTYLPSSLAAAAASDPQGSLRSAIGPRDDAPPLPLYAERAKRALNNMHEAMPVFIPLALLAVIRGDLPLANTGAAVFFVARALYVPAYILSPVPGLRSLLWMTSFAGLMVMVAGLLG